jgi:hypothetical protein
MAARMALINDKLPLAFHSILLEYLSRCIIDHPHHVLPVIFALVNAHKDAHINQQQHQTTTSSNTKKNNTTELIQLNYEVNSDARSRAAQFLLDECAKIKPQLVDQMRKLNDAYIEAAYWDVTPTKSEQQGKDSTSKNPTFSKHLRLMHIKDFHEVAVPTITIPVKTIVEIEIRQNQAFSFRLLMMVYMQILKQLKILIQNMQWLVVLMHQKNFYVIVQQVVN